MTPSEHARRIERAAKAISDQFEQGYRGHWCAEWQKDGRCERCTEVASAALDAADEAVPAVPVASLPLQERNARWLGLGAEYEGHALDPAKLTLYYANGLTVLERAERAEAAARDLAKAVRRYLTLPYERVRRDEDEFARRVLDRLPSFSGEEGTEG